MANIDWVEVDILNCKDVLVANAPALKDIVIRLDECSYKTEESHIAAQDIEILMNELQKNIVSNNFEIARLYLKFICITVGLVLDTCKLSENTKILMLHIITKRLSIIYEKIARILEALVLQGESLSEIDAESIIHVTAMQEMLIRVQNNILGFFEL
jgi:hypothetical protein